MTTPAQQPSDQSAILWTPSAEKVENALITDFMKQAGKIAGRNFSNYHDLWSWSVEAPEDFWTLVWDFCSVIGERGRTSLDNPGKMIGGQYFPDSKINYAENLLRHRGPEEAIIFRDEKGFEKDQDRILSRDDLYYQVSVWAQAMRAAGVTKGDRVVGYMPNMPETIIAMLAAVSIGAIWASASPDFGVQGVLDRFGQIRPKLLIAVDGYYYNGKNIDCLEKIKKIQPQLESLEKTIIVPFFDASPDIDDLHGDTVLDEEFTAAFTPQEIEFERVEFNHPLFIMFSSGTTGVPKCIVHGSGGTLLQHLKEHQLQCDIKEGDNVFYFTTCGWMMWNWQVTALASGATLMLFDGSPFYPNGNMLWDYAEKHSCTLFGTSAKYIDALKGAGLKPGETYDLSDLRAITSTGSPLVHESFDYVYGSIKQDVHLASISGGTDIVSCFILGNPISPVYRGEIQGPGLGMAMDIFDDNGNSITGVAGELVCTRPFPSMPVCFWNDEDGNRYRSAYFDRFDNIWCHGDWVERTQHGGFIIHGRSDATLNPGGVRIGTAEIYRQVEQIDGIRESIAVGQDFDDDVRVILFVTLKDGVTLDDTLIKDIKTRIRNGASPRHVPAKIIAVTDIPRTKSGKITELAVRDVIMGRPIKNVEALANPESLELYKNLPELRM